MVSRNKKNIFATLCETVYLPPAGTLLSTPQCVPGMATINLDISWRKSPVESPLHNCTELHNTALHNNELDNTTLHNTALHNTALHNTALHRTEEY